jgi:hypothetical protein
MNFAFYHLFTRLEEEVPFSLDQLPDPVLVFALRVTGVVNVAVLSGREGHDLDHVFYGFINTWDVSFGDLLGHQPLVAGLALYALAVFEAGLGHQVQGRGVRDDIGLGYLLDLLIHRGDISANFVVQPLFSSYSLDALAVSHVPEGYQVKGFVVSDHELVDLLFYLLVDVWDVDPRTPEEVFIGWEPLYLLRSGVFEGPFTDENQGFVLLEEG